MTERATQSSGRIVAIGAFAIVVILSAGAATWLSSRLYDVLSLGEVLDRAQAARETDLADLGPNSTFHYVLKDHDESVKSLPPDRVLDLWIAFDADGNEISYTRSLSGLDGVMYQRSVIVDGKPQTLDVRTGRLFPDPGASGLTAGKLHDALIGQIPTSRTYLDLSAPARTQRIDGLDVFAISLGHDTLYIDRATYRIVRVRSEDADNGNIAISDATLEVLVGVIKPTPPPAP